MGCASSTPSLHQPTPSGRTAQARFCHGDSGKELSRRWSSLDIIRLENMDVVELARHEVQAREMPEVCSMASQRDLGLVSYKEKACTRHGTGDAGVGYACHKGLKPRHPNQDSWSAMTIGDSLGVYGVYDGHGQFGHDVSNLVKDILPKLILQHLHCASCGTPKVLKEAFMSMQTILGSIDRLKHANCQYSGTTATVMVHDFEHNKVSISNVGDSTAVVARRVVSGDTETVQVETQMLSRDHKPELPDERERIERHGGKVLFDGYCHRMNARKDTRATPGLNMSRCLGDLQHHQYGCSAEPEVCEYSVSPEDEVLLLCSDGVWEVVTPAEAAEVALQYSPDAACAAAEALAQRAWSLWMKGSNYRVADDITVVLVYLQHRRDDQTSTGTSSDSLQGRQSSSSLSGDMSCSTATDSSANKQLPGLPEPSGTCSPTRCAELDRSHSEEEGAAAES